MNPLISLKDIKKQYLMVNALRGVSFEIQEGEFIAIIGQSGSGKSTLMHIIGFLDVPSQGSYSFDQHDTASLDEDELADIRSQKIGFIFQAFNLLPRTSALDNVRLPLVYQGVSMSQQKQRAVDALTKVGLQDRMGHKPSELSGGQQQRVAIARALITDPRLILADEPTGNLDSKASQEIIELFRALNREGRTIIIVTHDPEIAKISKRIIQLKDGQVISDQSNRAWTS